MSETEPTREDSLKNMLEEYLKIFNNAVAIEMASEEVTSEVYRRTVIQNLSKEILSVIPKRVGAINFEDITTVREDIDTTKEATFEVWRLENVYDYLNSLEEKIRETYLDSHDLE